MMETTFDALNPGAFQSFTEQKIQTIKLRYIKIAIIAGVIGLLVGGVLEYVYYEDN
jgi:hypothetical protein